MATPLTCRIRGMLRGDHAASHAHACKVTWLTRRHTLQGDYGPFKANFPVTVPLWLAIYLYQRKQCRIQPPDWLKVDHLQGR